MKKIVALVLSLITALSCAIPIFGATSVDLEKKKMLESVERQLIAQDAERFLPIYEQYLDLMYSPQTGMYSLQTRSGAPYETTLSDGGIIYYENFLGTGVEMCNTYLSDELYNDAYEALEPSERALGLVESVGYAVGFAALFESYVVGGVFAAYDYIGTQNDMDILRAGAAYNCVARDYEGYAQVTLPWENSPKASYYDGADVEWF